jgi:hypothetical protein
VLSDLFLNVGGRGVNGNVDCASCRFGFLACVNGSCGETLFLGVWLFGDQGMRSSEMESLAKRTFSQNGKVILLLSYPTPYPRSNELKDLEAVGHWVFEE